MNTVSRLGRPQFNSSAPLLIHAEVWSLFPIMIIKLCFSFLCFLFLVSSSDGLIKRFVSSWDFLNERNWRHKDLPCAGKPTFFSEMPDFPVTLWNNVALESISFHRDTELIFSTSSSLVFSDDKDKTCKNKHAESVFEVHKKGHWWDPDSWECEGGTKTECNQAVPDIYRVPCPKDSVIIPSEKESFYTLQFTFPIPSVTQLTLGGTNVGGPEFFDYVTSDSGSQRIFRSDLSEHNYEEESFVFIETTSPCLDITGCMCHPSPPKEEICKRMTHKCPPIEYCNKPVTMEGSCCPRCGVDISINHNGSLKMDLVQSTLAKFMSGPPSRKDVDGYAAKMKDGLIHVYFMPTQLGAKYIETHEAFLRYFDRKINSLGEVYKTSALIAKGPIAVQTSQRNLSWIATLVIFIICIVAALAYMLNKRRLSSGQLFSFRRMSLSGRISMRSTSIPSSVHITSIPTSEGRSFTNPTFMTETECVESPEQRRVSLANLAEISKEQGIHQKENPLFEESGAMVNLVNLKTPRNDDDELEQSEVALEKQIVVPEQAIMIDIETEPVTAEDDSDDETDPLEELARSRLVNVIVFDDKEGKKSPEEDLKMTDSEQSPGVGNLISTDDTSDA